MAVNSTTFGSVTLTGEDAKKFNRQVTYGRPKPAAKASVARGVALVQEFRANGRELAVEVPPRR